MRTVYIDVLVFINMLEDFWLLEAVKYLSHLKAKRWRIVLGSFFGGIISLLSLFQISFVLSVLIKISSAAALTLITFGFKGKKMFIKTCLALITVSFLVSGALICFYLAFEPKGMAIINDTVYFDFSPPLLIIFTLIVYFILMIIKRFFRNRISTALTKEIIILYKNNRAVISCKIDSGLNAKEPFSGNSVIIVDKASLGFDISEKERRIIPYSSLGGKGIIFGFKPDSVMIDNTETKEEVYIGMCEGVFTNRIKGLVPQSILGE